jgi:hypothetical protein
MKQGIQTGNLQVRWGNHSLQWKVPVRVTHSVSTGTLPDLRTLFGTNNLLRLGCELAVVFLESRMAMDWRGDKPH